MLPNLGPGELILILAIALIIFGPKKLPEIGKGVGKALREFNKARNDFMDSLHAEPDRDETRYSPVPSTVPSTEYTGSASSAYPDRADEDDVEALPYGARFEPHAETAAAAAAVQDQNTPTSPRPGAAEQKD